MDIGLIGVALAMAGLIVARGVNWRMTAAGKPGSCPVTCAGWVDAVAYWSRP